MTPIGITLSLDGVQQTEAGLRRVAGGMDSVGVSAKQTAAALRGVPAQFTDIITSLQGGQAPLTVFLQQGGQLKDMFGGAGAAAKALGGYVLGLATPFNVAAAAVAGIGYAMYKGAEQQRAFQQALIVSGNAAGATAGQIEQAYANVARATKQYGASEDIINGLVRSRQVGIEQLQATATAVAQYSKAAGVDAKALVADFAAIGKDPVKAVQALMEKYGILSAATYQQAAALLEQGKQQEAVILVQTRAAESMDKIGKAAKENRGYLEQFWAFLSSGAAGVWQGTMNLGKDETPESKLERLRQTLADKQARGPLNDTDAMAASYAKGLSLLQAEIDKTQALVFEKQNLAKEQGDLAQINDRSMAGVERLNAAYNAHLSKSEQLIKQLRELKQARDDALKGEGVDVAAVTQRYERAVEDVKRQLAPSFSMPALLHSLLIQESGNRQFRDDGSVVTNARSGATGIAQIMPQYGADYARMAGVEWSLESLKTNADYGKRLAEAGIKTYLKMFGNDVEKALAAYNWGPENVKNAVGQVGDAWRSKLPAETSKYISGILGRMPKDQAGDYSDALGAAPSSAFDSALIDARKKLAQATAEADAAQRGLTKSQAEFEVLQASPVWATFNAAQKDKLESLSKEAEVQDRIKQSADDGHKIKAKTDALRAMNDVYGKGQLAVEQWTLKQIGANAAVAEALGQDPKMVAQLKATLELQRDYVATLQAADIKQTMQGLEEWARSAQEQAKLYQEEAQLAGLTTLERNKIVAARQVELKLAKEIAAIERKDWSGDDGERAKADTIAKAREAAQIESSAAVAKVVRDDWAKTSDEINRSLTDALLRGFESGKDFAKNFRDTLVNMFKTLVLRPIISAVMQPVSMAVNGAVQGGMSALGMGGGSNLMGMAGTASSAYSLISGGLASSLGGIATSVGNMIGSSALSSFGAGLSGATLAPGLIGPTTAGATGAMGAGASAGSLLASIPGWGWALAGVAALGLGGAFDSRGANHSGGVFSTTSTDRNAQAAALGLTGNALGDFTDRANADIDKQLGQTVGQLSAVYQSLTKYAGDSAKQIDIAAGFAANGKHKDEDAYAYFKLLDKATGGTLASYTRRDGGLGNDPTKAYAQFTADMGGALIDELKKADIPSWMKTVFDGLDKDITLDKLNSAVSLVQQLGGLFENMSRNLVGFAGMADTTFQKLVENMGGVEAASKGVAAYYQGFYSESERAAAVRRDITAELTKVGLTLPATRAEFRALVEANIALGTAGAKTVATLLGVADAFAGVTQEVQDTAALLEAQAAALKKQREDAYSALDRAVSAEKKLLQDQLSAARDVEKSIGSIFTLLHDNVLSLYGTVDGTRAMQAQQGQTFIAQALATAKASGYLPDADQLKEAISAVRGELDNSTDNRAERDYAALVLAGQLSGMEDIAGKQLSDAKRTIQVLEGQSKQLDKTLDYWRQQIDIANGTYDATLSVSDAVNRLSALLGGGGKPGSSTPGGGGSSGYTAGGGVSQRVGYGADEALTSFDKFKAWYDGLRHNVDPKMLMGSGYQVPDWMRVMHMAGDSTDKELFGAYLNMKNNPETARDYERIMTTGRSGMVTDGSTLVRSDLSTMPKEIREYFEKDRNSLLSYEAMGIDPVLGYKLYKDGTGQFGIDKNTNLTSWLQQHKWTEGGVVSNNNAMDTLNNWKGYNLARWDLATGTVVDLDGKIYTADGQLIGSAGNGLMQQVYGSAFVGASGKDYGDATRSALYASQVTGGATQADYYANIKTGLDQAIASGKSAQDIADAIRSTGASMGDVAGAYGITVQQLEDNLRAGGATNIPKFSVGTNYVPRDMLAQIHEGEAIVPKAYNPWAGGGTSSNERLEALIERLTAEVAELRAAADATAANTGKSAAVLVSVQSGNSLTTAPVPVF